MKLNLKTIEISGVDHSEFPKYSSAYISFAETTEGRKLTDNEKEEYENKNKDFVCQHIAQNPKI